jgi:AbrB family looped-hinge helix DNA binding protein
MNGISTLTQKGQVAIPKEIRNHFKLKASDKIYFSVQGDTIVAKPIHSIEDMYGIIKTKRVFSKSDMKKVIRESVVEKYGNNS